jgi:hypothetical protein
MSYKRNQIEEAIARIFAPNCEKPPSELRARIKRLLELDRSLGRKPRSKDAEEASFGFFSEEAPGTGADISFSEYEAFALLKMRKTDIRRLEALEKEERCREQRQRCSLRQAAVYIWIIVLAYYLGNLQSNEDDENDPYEAQARALGYPSGSDFFEAGFKKKDISEIRRRYHDAYRRLFAKVGLDFDDTPASVLFDAVVTMIDQLPEQWLNWLRSNLQQWCKDVELAPGSNVPRRLSGDNLFVY